MLPPPLRHTEPPGPVDPDALLAALDAEQRAVAQQPLGPMCVLAGAGTGKTRAITHRIAYGVAAGVLVPQRVLAVTFTARAAGELRTRLRELGARGVQARTFHAAALRQLRYFWPQAVGGAAPQIVPHKAPLVAEAGARLGLRLDRAAIRDLAAELEWAKVGMLTHETYAGAAQRAHREPPGMDVTAMARLIEEYEQVKSERAVIDFEDVLLLLVGILREHGRVAAAIREQYRHFVVDEYQDVNAVQQRLLDLWVGDRDDVCVVGDPVQTIYSFTGASPKHLLDFARRHPKAATVRLVRNYRSTPQVVGLANTVLRARSTGGGTSAGVQLRAVAAAGPPPQLVRYDDDEDEAVGTAAAAGRLIAQGIPAAQIAVLYRTNSQAEALETAFAAADLPYLVRGGERFFSREEVRRAVVLLRGAARSDDGVSPLPRLVGDVLTGAGWSPEPPAGRGAVRDQWESLQSLVRLAEELTRGLPQARLREFIAELDERAAASHAPTVDGVTLASLHAAKGLEWDAVFLIGASEGLLPISMALTSAQIEEERRLLYVGLTRARTHLSLSWAAARPGGRPTRRPSRFLAPAAGLLGAAALPDDDPSAGGSRGGSLGASRAGSPGGSHGGPGRRGAATRRAPARCRGCGGELPDAAARKVGRCADCPPGYDEQTMVRLQQWRADAAARAKVPAFVVFTDATLASIAERMPADLPALARISGVGAVKLERYGAGVLGALHEPTPPA
ncbi:DNA helicase-2/ATP-dependent DNA helicase PcrA [Kineosphaera limosa]|uniref:DNA 3'-5' helicase n=1 Tax=Kineosphaera limosa NBRC 100340 TaxID=1184609 RepID=K6WYJ2_9MICO|nr:ATP-dependent DNA helicase UvrD2 [Kineosphaera limosa]NYE02527.1 DNA helicase-2/ATP-dependent DNA helicase PcrA [Kineosphaera limosa]GAB97172.1 putative ATP-dependent DNA helicase [Kineosphaera limosa NBRC 100340]